MLVLVAVVQDRLASHTLLSPGDGGHFPHSPGGPVPDVPSLHTFAVSLARGGALHLSGSVRVDGPEVLVLLHPPTEGVSHVIVVILLSLALHEQSGALDELVHGHDDPGVTLGETLGVAQWVGPGLGQDHHTAEVTAVHWGHDSHHSLVTSSAAPVTLCCGH